MRRTQTCLDVHPCVHTNIRYVPWLVYNIAKAGQCIIMIISPLRDVHPTQFTLN